LPWLELHTKRAICGTKQPEFSVAPTQHNTQTPTYHAFRIKTRKILVHRHYNGNRDSSVATGTSLRVGRLKSLFLFLQDASDFFTFPKRPDMR